MLSILVADSHDIFQAGFSAVINKFQFVRNTTVAGNRDELFTIVKNVGINVAFVDAEITSLNGIDIIEELQKQFPLIKIIGMGMTANVATASQMMNAGASGFILKSISTSALKEALLSVIQGKTYLCKEVEKSLHSNTLEKILNNHFPLYKQRFREMLYLICRELTTKEISYKLNISQKTVEKYRKELLDATGSKNMVGLALFAVQNNIHCDQNLQSKFTQTTQGVKSFSSQA